MKTLTIIAATGAPHKRPRLEKTIRIARSRGIPLAYWGWRRNPNEPMGTDIFEGEHRVLLAQSAGGWLTALGYLRLGAAIFGSALRQRKSRTFWALGFETAVWLRLARVFVEIDYVFDDADRFVLTAPIPTWLIPLVKLAERSVAKNALAHIIPAKDRYDYDFGKFVVIENLPDQQLVQRSLTISVDPPEARLLVYVSGWIGPNRGSVMIERAARQLEDEGIIFVLATKTFDEAATSLMQLSNVHQLGYVPQPESLAWCRICHVSLTFYDPALRINQLAAPNKWGDALVCGRPFIVNSEVETATSWLQAGAAFAVAWNDDHALAQCLLSLRDDPSQLARANEAMTRLHTSASQYEDRIVEVFHKAGFHTPTARPQGQG